MVQKWLHPVNACVNPGIIWDNFLKYHLCRDFLVQFFLLITSEIWLNLMKSGQVCFNPVIQWAWCTLSPPPYCNTSVLWLGQNNQYMPYFSLMTVFWYLLCSICQKPCSLQALSVRCCTQTVSNCHWILKWLIVKNKTGHFPLTE